MAVARLVAAPFPLAASRARGPPARLAFAPLPLSSSGALPRRAAAPVLRVASDGRADAAEVEADDETMAAARRAVSERKARKESERRTYLVAAVMSSLGITSMAAAAVYYRFAWQMEVPLTFLDFFLIPWRFPPTISFPISVLYNSYRSVPTAFAFPGRRRNSGDGNVRHLRTLRGRRGRDGVLGALGAPRAVARLAVAHARVAPPAPRRAIRAQRRLRHRQRRPGHGPPRLRLLQPRTRPGTLLRRGARDHAVRDGVHVRARRPGPPPLPRRAHRERALLPAGRRRPPDSSHGQVRQRAIWPVPRTQGAGGGGRDGGAGEGDPEEDQEKRDARRDAMRNSYSICPRNMSHSVTKIAEYIVLFSVCDVILLLNSRGLVQLEMGADVVVGQWSTLVLEMLCWRVHAMLTLTTIT